jgi:hypothetical protein
MTRHRIPKVRLRNHIVTLKEEEVLEGDRMLVETIFPKEEEEAEEER